MKNMADHMVAVKEQGGVNNLDCFAMLAMTNGLCAVAVYGIAYFFQ